MKKLTISIATVALTGAALLGSATAAHAECTEQNKCADISVSGHAEPQPIRKGQKTTLKITAKNNGPVDSYGNWVQATVPKQLKVKGKSISGDGNDHGCDDNGYGFIKCYTGDLKREELSVVKIKVKAKRKGTFIIPAQAYADGSTYDENQGNNEVKITVGVGGRGR